MAEMEISLLGTPAILIEGRPFDTDRRKAIALLAYLIETGKPQTREHLAALFWPDYNRESAFAYLRRTLYELNKGLGEKWLLTDRNTAGFDFAAGALVDTLVFERELAAARSQDDPLPHLEAAAAQYKGEFLADFFVQDTAPFEDWLRQQRESYRGEYATLLERLAVLYAGRHSWEPALKHALAWVALDDLNEPAHRLVMRIYAEKGERGSAVRQYEICVQALKHELGVKPQPETTALFERIRTGSFEKAAHLVELQPPGEKRLSGLHLPILATPFIGRRVEIEQVKALILDANSRLLTLLGPGGIGKTRLSIQVASEIGEHFADGVWFVPLATVPAADGFVAAVAKALDFSFYLEGEAPPQQLLQFLQRKQLLLILDNIDHLVSGETARQLIEILSSAPAVKLLVTSRIRLNIQAERVFPVPGMHIPALAEAASWADPETMAKPFSAVQLFLDRARSIQPDFNLNRANAAAVAEICQLVSGMPLGLELAASWLELLPPEEIKAEIRRSLDFLETDQPDVPDRQRSIRAVFDYSWKLLNEDEREIFLQLSVFIGSFTRQAAQQVSGAALRTLLSLAGKSWLQQVAGGRFQLHPLLQHYGLERLRKNETAWRSACEQHARYYAGFAASQQQRLRGAEQLAALEEFSEEFDTNLKAAWDWLVAEERWLALREQMLMGLFHFASIRERGDELIRWMRNARLKLDQPSGAGQPSAAEEKLTLAILGTVEVFFEEMWGIKEGNPADRLRMLWRLAEDQAVADSMGFWFTLLGKVYISHNDDPQAEARIEAAIERIRKQNDAWLLGVALLMQSYLWGYFLSGRLMENMDRYLQEALLIFKELGTIYEQGEILRNMAENAIAKQRPLEEAIDLFQQAQQFAMRLNNLIGIGGNYWDLGNIYFMRGRFEEGFAAYHEAQRYYDQLGNLRALETCLSWESIWATRYSTFEHALETRQRSVKFSQTYMDQTNYFWSIYELAEIYRIFGDKKKAVELYEEAQRSFERINLTLGKGYYQRALGDIAMREGRYAEALQHYQAYQAYANRDNHTWSMAQAAVKRAWAHAHRGEIELSRSSNYSGLKLLQRGDDVALELMALLSEARCLAEAGKNEEAAALAAFAAGHPLIWKETGDLARGLLSSLSQHLDTETFQAACSRLQGRDVRELTSEWLANYEELKLADE